MSNGAMVVCLLTMGWSLSRILCLHLSIFHIFLLKLDFDMFFFLEHVWSTKCFVFGLLDGGYHVSCFSLFRTFVSLTFDMLDSLWFLLIDHMGWWLVVGLLFGDDVFVLDSFNLIWWGLFLLPSLWGFLPKFNSHVYKLER